MLAFMFGFGSFLVGVLLAGRYKVLALLPATALAVSFAVTFVLTTGASLQATLLTAVLVSVCMQLGYFARLAGRYLIGAGRARWRRLRQNRPPHRNNGELGPNVWALRRI
jgi:hypothetical protein